MNTISSQKKIGISFFLDNFLNFYKTHTFLSLFLLFLYVFFLCFGMRET